MKVEVRFRGVEASESLREHAVRRSHAGLSRFGAELEAVVVRIDDVNGPKGGVDKRCRVVVRGRRFSPLSFDGVSGDAWSAVDLALERITRAVGRELQRARSYRRDDEGFGRAS
jgi:hypothetical protein